MKMALTIFDWLIIGGVFLLTTAFGLIGSKVAGRSKADFFVGGRAMPWWLLGFSMVATTFSTEVPNLIAGFVRDYGVCGNWLWWAMLPTGMLTVFLYAKLWRRSEVITDLEYYEIRYSGKTAALLRGFRAVYLGLFFNIFVMASSTLAAIKIGAAMLGLTPVQSVLFALIITAVFSSAAGLRGVLFSDLFLFILAMLGTFVAAYYSLTRPEVGGLSGMMNKLSAMGQIRKTEVMGFASAADWMALFIIPITILWWSIWYPCAEPGGGGFIAQRMLAAKNEEHAAGATLFFNFLHYAIRPWPMILVALCSLIVFPTSESLNDALCDVLPASQIKSDAAYSLMLKSVPTGWLGLIVASLFAAYVSTMSTLTNWGSSYLVHDFYGRFIRRNSSEKEQVLVGRIFSLLLIAVSCVVALFMESAMGNFNILLSIGAGTGLLFMMRWFWWRINAAAEITAMVASFAFSLYFNIVHDKLFIDCVLSDSQKMVCGVALTTLAWVLACYLGPQTEKPQLYSFCRKINPAGPGWNAVRLEAARAGVDLSNPEHPQEPLWQGIVASVFGCIAIYGALYGIGELVYCHWLMGLLAFFIAIPAALFMWYFGVVRSGGDRTRCV